MQNKLFPGIVAVCTTFVIVFKAFFSHFSLEFTTTVGVTARTDPEAQVIKEQEGFFSRITCDL